MASTSTAASGRLSGDFFFGWKLLYKTIEKSIKRKSDLLVALGHFMLVKNSFVCIGIGEETTVSDEDRRRGGELLPDGWNANDEHYALRYLSNTDKLYILLAQNVEDDIIITLLDAATNEIANIALVPNQLVDRTSGSVTDMIPTVAMLYDRYLKELLEPVFSGKTRIAETQTSPVRPMRSHHPLRVVSSEPRRPSTLYSDVVPLFSVPEVGRGDLDPLGRGSAGNLLRLPYQPNGQNNEPPAANPRPDPLAPPDLSGVQGPDPDHLQPPDYENNDQFFM